MIKDELLNAELYYRVSERLKIGFEWLRNTELNEINDGKYNIEGENVYANVQTYETKEDAKYEAHQKYIDIQYMIKGEEKIGVCALKNCNTCIEYDTDKDIEFFDINDEDNWQLLKEGDFLVLFPNDAHKPSISLNNKLVVKKAVVKVKID